MRWWPAILVLWCACRCVQVNERETPLERLVAAPVTLDEVRAAARAPDLVAAQLARAWQSEPRLNDRVKQRLRDDLLRNR